MNLVEAEVIVPEREVVDGGSAADEQHEQQQPRRDRRGAVLVDAAQAEELEPNGGDHIVHRGEQARELELQPAHDELPRGTGSGSGSGWRSVRGPAEGQWAGIDAMLARLSEEDGRDTRAEVEGKVASVACLRARRRLISGWRVRARPFLAYLHISTLTRCCQHDACHEFRG